MAKVFVLQLASWIEITSCTIWFQARRKGGNEGEIKSELEFHYSLISLQRHIPCKVKTEYTVLEIRPVNY